ncbi:hypothetical protein BJX76DRAFT_369104 [Aspergillus varians]
MASIRRRNGRKPACEACRRRKLACDHGYPVCRRCDKQSVECVYLERGSNRTDEGVQPVSNPPSPPPQGSEIEEPSIISRPTEYLGPSGFTSVFLEHGDRFELAHLVTAPGDASSDLLSITQRTSEPGTHLLQAGAQVLRNIPDEQDCQKLFSKHINPNDGWIRLAGRYSSDRIWTSFRLALTRRSGDDLRGLAAQLSEHSRIALRDEQDPQTWLASFTGRHTRWETLGILYTYWAFGAVSSTPESKPVSRYCRAHPSVRGPRELMVHFKHHAQLCIDLCRQLGSINVLYVYLLYKHNILESILNGDKSLPCWTQHGELVAVATSLGLHREPQSETKPLTPQREMGRRVYAAVFNIDKVLATFTGRPPMLSLAYSSTPLPLDLSDHVLLSGDLAAATASLDSHGWSKDGRIYSTTILRARTMFARIRHDILELFEASREILSGESTERATTLKRTTQQTYLQLPESMQYSAARAEEDPAVSGSDLYAQILTRLEFLLNMFLLERLLARHKVVPDQGLIDVSQEMLVLTLTFWKKKDRFVGLYSDFEWLVMSYGVPSSGILCLELLRQATHPESHVLTIPRSEVIQNLSLLVAYLEWIQPSASCRETVSFIRKVLAQSLDRVLNMPFLPQDIESTRVFGLGALIEDSGFEQQPGFTAAHTHTELLNTFDWVDWSGGVEEQPGPVGGGYLQLGTT